jgi:hypothetical protein
VVLHHKADPGTQVKEEGEKGRRGEGEKGRRGEGEKDFSFFIFHFSFSIFHFPFFIFYLLFDIWRSPLNDSHQ